MEYYGNHINGVWKMIEARPGYLHMSINVTWMAPFCLSGDVQDLDMAVNMYIYIYT